MLENQKTFIIIIVVLVVVLTGSLFYMREKNNSNAPTLANQDTADIQVYTPQEGQVIFSPVKISGIVRKNGWAGFEGQVGVVVLLDGDGKELGKTYLPAKDEWTQLPINFETTLEFSAPEKDRGFLIFHNENPSGDPVRDKVFSVPVRFK